MPIPGNLTFLLKVVTFLALLFVTILVRVQSNDKSEEPIYGAAVVNLENGYEPSVMSFTAQMAFAIMNTASMKTAASWEHSM